MEMGKATGKYYLTLKGIATIAAIESGLLKKVEGGWDNEKFNIFWEKVEQEMTENYLQILSDKEKAAELLKHYGAYTLIAELKTRKHIKVEEDGKKVVITFEE